MAVTFDMSIVYKQSLRSSNYRTEATDRVSVLAGLASKLKKFKILCMLASLPKNYGKSVVM